MFKLIVITKNNLIYGVLTAAIFIALLSGLIFFLHHKNASASPVQEFETLYYKLSVPQDWKIEMAAAPSDKAPNVPFPSPLVFKKSDRVIGALEIKAYEPSMGKCPFLIPGDVKIKTVKRLKGFYSELIKVNTELSSPPGRKTHYCFIIKDKDIVYDLYFDNNFVDEETALKAAKSFKSNSGL